MKKTLVTVVFLILGAGSWAQSNTAEEDAIKKVLETEMYAAQNRDYEQWIDCFANSPDVAFGFTSLLPTYMVRSYDKLAEFGKSFFQNNPVSSKGWGEFTDFQIRINGNSAFVTCLQLNTKPDGSKDRYHKANYLEKIGGRWKIIGHFFSREPEAASGAGNK